MDWFETLSDSCRFVGLLQAERQCLPNSLLSMSSSITQMWMLYGLAVGQLRKQKGLVVLMAISTGGRAGFQTRKPCLSLMMPRCHTMICSSGMIYLRPCTDIMIIALSPLQAMATQLHRSTNKGLHLNGTMGRWWSYALGWPSTHQAPFSQEEFDDLIFRLYPNQQYYFALLFFGSVFSLTRGHLGAVLGFMTAIVSHDMGFLYLAEVMI